MFCFVIEVARREKPEKKGERVSERRGKKEREIKVHWKLVF